MVIDSVRRDRKGACFRMSPWELRKRDNSVCTPFRLRGARPTRLSKAAFSPRTSARLPSVCPRAAIASADTTSSTWYLSKLICNWKGVAPEGSSEFCGDSVMPECAPTLGQVSPSSSVLAPDSDQFQQFSRGRLYTMHSAATLSDSEKSASDLRRRTAFRIRM